MQRTRVVFALVILIALLLLSAVATLIDDGYNHVYPGSYQRWAKESWEGGDRRQAVQYFIDGATEALECGVRDRLAQSDIDEMKSLEEKEQFDAAFKRCMSAVRTLEGCDDEGGLDNHCTYVELRIHCDVVEGQLDCNR